MQTNQLKQPNAHQQQHGQRKLLDSSKHGPSGKGSPNPAIPPTNGTHPQATVSQRYCRLIQTAANYKFENLDEANKIYQFEEAYIEFTKRCQNDANIQELLVKERDFHRLVSKATIFAFLADAPDAAKNLSILMAASQIDQWQETLTSINKIIFDGFVCIRPQVRLKLVHLLEFLIDANPSNLDNIIINFFRELNSGNCIGSTEDVVKLLGVTAEMFIRKKEWFQKYPSNNNSVLFPCIFGTFSRFLSDLPTIYDRCRQHLIHVVDFILREHFQQLLPMGRELVLAMQRVSKIFPAYWKNLTYQPQSLLPNFEGIPQLLSTKCSQAFSGNRIAFRLQFLLDRILLYRPEIIFSFHFEWLTADFLNGFDANSLRAELIRFAINNPKYQAATEQIKQSRNALFVYLVTNAAKKNTDQISKLALIFDCICSDRENSNSSVLVLESVFMALRYFLDKQPDIGNSLLELLVRTTMEFHPKFSTQLYLNLTNNFRVLLSMGSGPQTLIENRQIDKNLRLALVEFLPELYAKQRVGDAAPNPPNKLDDLANETRIILEQASGDPKVLFGGKADKRKLRVSRSSDHELDQIRRGLLDEETKRESKSLEELIPNLKEQFRQAVKHFRDAVDKSSTDDAIDPTDEARQLFTLIKESPELVDKEQTKLLASCVLGICARYLNEKQFYKEPNKSENSNKPNISEQLNKPIFVLFNCIYKARNQKLNERKIWLQLARQMAKQNSSMGYLFLFFLSNNLIKNNKIEVICYYEFVDVMKSTNREQLCQDMSMCAIDCTQLFSFLLPYVFASFNEASGCLSLIESICVTLDEHQTYSLASHVYMRGDVTLFKKDTFDSIFRASLKWNTHAQNTFWQLIRVGNISSDWIFDSLAVVKEAKHPTASINVLSILQYMKIDITPSTARGLFLRCSDDDFTLKLLNLIVTNTDTQNQVGQRLVSLLKIFIKKEDFYRSVKPKAVTQEKRTPTSYSNLQTAFEHLEKVVLHGPQKKGSFVQGLVKAEPLLGFYRTFKKNEKVFEEMQSRFNTLFTVWKEADENATSKPSKPGKGRKLNDQAEARETKAKKPKVVYELSDDEA